METLEQNIGYHFQQKKYLKEALTHSSCVNDSHHSGLNNERLEFLGDSVLSLVVSNYLFRKYPNRSEGELTKIRASLVCTYSLSSFARQFHLGEYLYLGKGEEHSGGRDRDSILENAFEALVGAIYLDAGFEEAERFVMRFIPDQLAAGVNRGSTDYKTALQEIIQQNREEKISYVLTMESGPDHDKTFEVEVHLNSNPIGTGVGKSKKQAEQNAAQQALELMGYEI
ncbi:MAG TPA: ribonuclease III [Firmicutes bacterium]|nr:ribonuclease III [Bacillota bacterium]